jgi:hypothetical protein
VTTIRVELDESTYDRLRRLAEATGRSVEDVAAEAVIERTGSVRPGDPAFGWLANEPHLADAIDEATKQARQERFGPPRATDPR